MDRILVVDSVCKQCGKQLSEGCYADVMQDAVYCWDCSCNFMSPKESEASENGK